MEEDREKIITMIKYIGIGNERGNSQVKKSYEKHT